MLKVKMLSFTPYCKKSTKGDFFLGYAMVTVPKGAWEERDVPGGDPFRPHGLCRKLKDGSLIMDIGVRHNLGAPLLQFNLPDTKVTNKDWVYEDLVKITPEMRDEIIVLLHQEIL